MSKTDYNVIYDRALDLLSRRDHSRRELIDKLIRKFGNENIEQINAACDELGQVGLIDDGRFARAYAEELIRHKHVSPAGLRAALIHKGIPRYEAELVVEEADIDVDEAIRILLKTKYKHYDLTNEVGSYKAFSALARMGFTYNDIKAVFYDVLERSSEFDDIY